VFLAGAPYLVSAALLTLPVQHAVHTRLYGIDTEHPDDAVVDTFIRLLLDGARRRHNDRHDRM